jgi:hypothetical protein
MSAHTADLIAGAAWVVCALTALGWALHSVRWWWRHWRDGQRFWLTAFLWALAAVFADLARLRLASGAVEPTDLDARWLVVLRVWLAVTIVGAFATWWRASRAASVADR